MEGLWRSLLVVPSPRRSTLGRGCRGRRGSAAPAPVPTEPSRLQGVSPRRGRRRNEGSPMTETAGGVLLVAGSSVLPEITHPVASACVSTGVGPQVHSGLGTGVLETCVSASPCPRPSLCPRPRCFVRHCCPPSFISLPAPLLSPDISPAALAPLSEDSSPQVTRETSCHSNLHRFTPPAPLEDLLPGPGCWENQARPGLGSLSALCFPPPPLLPPPPPRILRK